MNNKRKKKKRISWRAEKIQITRPYLSDLIQSEV
jgi:hypothetical protein